LPGGAGRGHRLEHERSLRFHRAGLSASALTLRSALAFPRAAPLCPLVAPVSPGDAPGTLRRCSRMRVSESAGRECPLRYRPGRVSRAPRRGAHSTWKGRSRCLRLADREQP
jgi:hypothetical protein